jgi:hypothetical protein
MEQMHRMGHASHEAALRYQRATRDRAVALAAILGDVLTAATPMSKNNSLRAIDAGA